MSLNVPFNFNDRICYCDAYIDTSVIPEFIFIILRDALLLEQFDDEVTIETDFERIIVVEDNSEELSALKVALFTALSGLPEFVYAKTKHKFYKQPAIHHTLIKET